ncbi:MAG TPA: arylesterase [Bdellovibrionota bacterium]|nr:arylesterase [Bdellovibrionota bacterium]
MLRRILPLLILIASPAWAGPLRIVAMGDSLTDGFGVAKDDAYPAVLDRKLEGAGYPDAEVVNAGLSGSTTASAEGRLKWHLKNKPDILILALGANDGLRGMKLSETRKNLSRVIAMAKEKGVEVLLAGMRVPPNYGKEFTEGFEALYRDLAREHSVALVPFLLEGIGGEKEMNLDDGIHPNERGHQKMAETILPHLLKLVKKLDPKAA